MIVIPARLRRACGIAAGSMIIAEAREDGMFLRPAVAVPREWSPPERRAECLLSHAVDAADYAQALEEVKKLGLGPVALPHQPP